MTATPSRYYPLLDAWRFLAAIAVVWLHIAGVPWLERSKVLGRFAVPFFTCTASLLAFDALRRHPATSVWRYFHGRLWRIYPLFLVWSVIYWAVRSGSSVLLEHAGWIRTTPRGFLLDGIAIQLWFLPFVIMATTAAFIMAKVLRVAPAWRLPLIGHTVLAGVFIAVHPAPGWVRAAGYSPGLAYDTLPACAWGIALGMILQRPALRSTPTVEAVLAESSAPPEPTLSGPVATIGAVAFAAGLVVMLLYGRSLLLENAAGLGLVLSALHRVSTRPVPFLAALGSISFGIYLAHALFVEGLQHILPKIGVVPSGLRDVLIWILSVLGSCTLILLLQRSGRWGAWLAG